MPFDTETIHPELALDAAPRTIPTELRKGLSPVEFHAYYIAMKDRCERSIQQDRKPVGVSWSGLGNHSTPYVGKSDDQIWAEAEAKASQLVGVV